MTRKQAILAAISLLEAKKGQEATIQKLKEISSDMPFVRWKKGSVFDHIEEFMKKNQRLPTASNLRTEEGMPAHPEFRKLFQKPFRAWMDENFPCYYEPKITRREALKTAISVTRGIGDAAVKLTDILEEYPWTEWNVKNITDGIQTFIDEHGRMPKNEDFSREKYLPYNELFRYKFQMTRNEWIAKYLPNAFDQGEAKKEKEREIQSDFICEYQNVKPVSPIDFERRRDKKKSVSSHRMMILFGLHSWEELLTHFHLPKYYPERKRTVLSVVVEII